MIFKIVNFFAFAREVVGVRVHFILLLLLLVASRIKVNYHDENKRDLKDERRS